MIFCFEKELKAAFRVSEPQAGFENAEQWILEKDKKGGGRRSLRKRL